ncbi:hypothetical protein PsorP6_002488 [Peronosclerospora sorghi]|uniref:Uncharacterized protein n=1 Tax=Peronosclerospora sorghi TaxID=230839 RepID=A0ACC0WY15_9STRA|nr:hypothetical protein PsorP6_002488 [Peronosclerospora sorghi]
MAGLAVGSTDGFVTLWNLSMIVHQMSLHLRSQHSVEQLQDSLQDLISHMRPLGNYLAYEMGTNCMTLVSCSPSAIEQSLDVEIVSGGDDQNLTLCALRFPSRNKISETRIVNASGNKTATFEVPQKYQVIKVVGAGTYGEVVVASDVESGTTVAIKKATNALNDLSNTKCILRELCLLRQLKHPNLMHLYDIPRPSRLSFLEDIYIVTELMETDLNRVILSTQTLTDEHVAHFMRQILRGLAYLHSDNILHRDLKPSNILVTSTCDAKIGDLGLARYVDYSKVKTMKGEMKFVDITEYVVTRWYRAPEILLDGCRYDKPSDLWSARCILAELLGCKPLFLGTITTTQLNKIFDVDDGDDECTP